jgi:DNA-binding MarR family transcriptional regulator
MQRELQPVASIDGSPKAAVHPGWLAVDRPGEADERCDEQDGGRFATFQQLMRTAGMLDRAATETLGHLQLTAGSFFALLELAAAGRGGVAPSELARRLSVARRTATLYVDILAQRTWAERVPHPDDRRMVLARLTPDGERVVAELGGAYRKRLGQLMESLSPMQAERLRQLLAAVSLESAKANEPSASR